MLESKEMLRGYKAIADRIDKLWGGTGVSVASVQRWVKMVTDPLPVKRIKSDPNRKRSIVIADPSAIDRWALRRIP
jgi:hypothetical protein